MEEKYNAIVLRAIDYKDNDKILTLFTLENGVISAAIRGVKKSGAKLKFAAQPFCFCEFVLNKNGERRTVVSADIIESFYPIREDILKFYAGAVALEFVSQFVQEGDGAKDIFLVLADFLKTLCYTDAPPRVALVKFLLEALAFSGYEISVSGCKKCRKTIVNRTFFDFGTGSAVCEDCRVNTDVEINPNTLKLLEGANTLPFDELNKLTFPQMIECKAIKLLTYFIEVKAGVVLRTANELLLLGK